MLDFQARVLRVLSTPPKSCWSVLCGFGSCHASAGTDRAGVTSIKPRRACACKRISSRDLTKTMNLGWALSAPRVKGPRGGHARAAAALVAVRRLAFQLEIRGCWRCHFRRARRAALPLRRLFACEIPVGPLLFWLREVAYAIVKAIEHPMHEDCMHGFEETHFG